jgi:alpha-tubulin suppressor-like RCC1 family protein
MKKISTLLVALFISATSFAQVGIGTNTPEAGAMLELKATDKALLLTRVATTAAVTTPVNGMMVYDISTNCIKGYQNGAWTGCLSACAANTSNASSGGEWGFDFTSTFLMIDASTHVTAGINPEGKVFIWGNNQGYKFFPSTLHKEVSGQLMTPAYAPLPGTETAKKVVVGKESVMVLTNSGKVYVMGLNDTQDLSQQYGPALNGKLQQWVQLTTTADTTFVDIDTASFSDNSYMVGTSGNFYHAGMGSSANSFIDSHRTGYVVMAKPTGVATNFKYTKVWGDSHKNRFFKVYVKGNDNKIYVWGQENTDTGTHSTLGVGTGVLYALAANMTPALLPFSGTYPNIVKISHDDKHALALADDGKAYGWGVWHPGGDKKQYTFAATPLAANIGIPYPNASYTSLIITRPTLLNKPNDGSTGFTDVLVIDRGSIVQTSEGVYFKGYDRGILSEPITGVWSTTSPYFNSADFIDALDGANYNRKAQTLSKFKTIFIAYWNKLFAINATNKGYFIGESYFGTGGMGVGSVVNETPYKEYYSRLTPISTGIGDPTNPNPLY